MCNSYLGALEYVAVEFQNHVDSINHINRDRAALGDRVEAFEEASRILLAELAKSKWPYPPETKEAIENLECLLEVSNERQGT